MADGLHDTLPPPVPTLRTAAAHVAYLEQERSAGKLPARGKRPAAELNTYEAVLQEIQRVYGEVTAGRLAALEGKRRVGLLQSMAGLMTQHQLEQRLARITAALERRGIIR